MNTHRPTPSELSRRTILGGAAVGATAMLTGCVFQSGKSGNAAGGSRKLTMVVPATIDSLDPHYVNNGGNVVPCGLLEGLVAFDSTGRGAVPAIASKWTTSADGLTYTFTIRPNAKYSNGETISAKDFEWTYQRLLSPTAAGGGGTLGASSYKPGLGIKGADEFQSGVLKDWSQVGIHANDDSTLVITLDAPNSDLLIGLADQSMLLLHPKSVQSNPKGWMNPANWVGSGPYVPTAWNPTASMTLKPHDHYWDRKAIHLDDVEVRVIADSLAALLAYRNNEVDIEPAVPSLYSNDTSLMEQSRQAKGYGVIYLQSQFSSHPASRDPRVRQAFSMAIDRSMLAKIHPLSQPGTALVPNSVPGWNDRIGTSYDPDKAKSLLAEAGYPGGKGMPVVQLLAGASVPELDAIAQMWKTTLGVTVKENVVDVGVYVATRYKPLADPNLMGFVYGTFGGVPTWPLWVYDLWGPDTVPMFSLPPSRAAKYEQIQANSSLATGQKLSQLSALTAAYATPEAKKFASDATAAEKVIENSARTTAFIDAAQERQALFLEIPVLWIPQAFLVKPTVTGVNLLYTPNGFYLKGIGRS